MAQVGVRLPQCYLYPKFLDVVGSPERPAGRAQALPDRKRRPVALIVDDAASYEEVSASAPVSPPP